MLEAYSADGERRPFLSGYHDIFDELAATLPDKEFKVFYVIYRETEGYSRESWPLSESFLQKRTGIKSHNTLLKVLLSLAHKGLIKMWEALHIGGTRFFALGDKLKSWNPLAKNDRGVSKNDRGVSKNTLIQRQLMQEEGKAEVIPWQKMTGGVSKNDRGGVKNRQGGVSIFDNGVPLETCQEEAPQNAKETLKERVKEKDKESGCNVPSIYYQNIEEQKERVAFAEQTYQEAQAHLSELSPLSKEFPEARREIRRAEHEVTRQKERLAIFELTVGFMEEKGYDARTALEKAKTMVLDSPRAVARSSA